MSWIITGKEAGPLGLLDQYGDAAAAYSLRNLSLYRTDPVVRVRRDNDDAEQDFTATEVSDGTLAAWVGAGNDGFVRTWYDQSGDGNHATQATNSNQPTLVNGGSVVLENGNPTLSFDGSNDFLTAPVIVNAYSIKTFFSVANSIAYILSTRISGEGYILSRNRYGHTGRGDHFFTYSGPNEISVNSLIVNSISEYAYINGSELSTSVDDLTLPNAGETLTYMGRQSTAYSAGKIAEIIVYPADQSANRAAIEANINAHYNIF